MKYALAAVLLLNFICFSYAAFVFETSNSEPEIVYSWDSDSEDTKVESYQSPEKRERSRTEPCVPYAPPSHLEAPCQRVRKCLSSDDKDKIQEEIIYFVEGTDESCFKPRRRSESFFSSSSSSAASARNDSDETFEGFEWVIDFASEMPSRPPTRRLSRRLSGSFRPRSIDSIPEENYELEGEVS